MTRVKIFMNQENYINIGNTHIFINWSVPNASHLDNLNPSSIHKVHVFLTDGESIVGGAANYLVQSQPQAKIIFHVPKQVKELKKLLAKYIEGDNYRCIVESKPVIFSKSVYARRLFYRVWYRVSINYNEDHISIDIGKKIYPKAINSPMIIFPKFYYGFNPVGIFETQSQVDNPLDFSEDLVEAFKQQCPEGILSSFKNDEDILEYIIQQGKWEVK